MSNLELGDVSSTNVDATDCLARAKAQVMTRQDDVEGWFPSKGKAGGMIDVRLSRTAAADEQHDSADSSDSSRYQILGYKDSEMVLECNVTKDLLYTHATPTFHHWQTDSRRYGLTFQSPTEAEAFERAVCDSIDSIRVESTPRDRTLAIVPPRSTSAIAKIALPMGIKAAVPDVPQECQPASVHSQETVASASNFSPAAPEVSTSDTESASLAPLEKNYFDTSQLQDDLPAVPPRRPLHATMLPSASDVPSVPPRAALNQYVPTGKHAQPRYSQSLSTVHRLPVSVDVHPKPCSSRHTTTPGVASDSPPVPPRPDCRAVSDVSRVVPANCDRSRSLVEHSRLRQAPHAVVTLPNSSSVSRVTSPVSPASSAYVYFTDNKDAPPPPVKTLKGKADARKWDNEQSRHRDVGRRLADSAWHDDRSPAGAYVRLALPSPTVDTHDYCYPSIDTVVPAPPAAAPVERRETPPPLPTKHRLSWRDCRRRYRHPHLAATTVLRPSYGTANTTVFASNMSLEGCDGSRQSCRSRFLCYMFPCVSRRNRWPRAYARRSVRANETAT